MTYLEFLLRCVVEQEAYTLAELMTMLDSLLIEMDSGLYALGEHDG